VQTNGPYVVSIMAATNPIRVGAGSSYITVTLNKHVPAFTLAHLQVTPGAGTFDTLSRVGSSASYRTLFTPTAGYVGTVAITVADNAFADTAGTLNVGKSSAPLVVDLVAPTITISSTLASLKAGQTTPVTFSFNEPVVGFTLSDVTVSGGTLSGFTGSGTSYSALFTPRTNSMTSGTISVAANRFTDAAGNPNVRRDLSPTIAINTVVPSMTIRQRLPVLKANQSTTVTFQVRGQVSGSDPFTAEDISLSPEQGSLSNFSGPSFVRGISTYTALYMAPATAFSGSVVLSVPANSFKVVGNNFNGNALTTLAIKIDAIAPTPVISSTATALKIGQTATIDFTVDGETGGLIGFEAGDITLTPSSGTLSAPTRVGSTSVYRSTYTPAVGFEGTVTIALAAGKFTDAAGNPNTIAAPITIAVDTSAPAAPTVSLVNDTGILGNDKITSDARLQTTGTEAGAAVNYWTTSALTTPWTPALAVQGSNTVYVTQTDTAGNPSPSNNFFTFEYRTTAPVVTSITLPAASTGLRAGAFLQLSVRFARPVFVTGATTDKPFITIGGFTTGASTRNAVYSSGSGTTTLVFRYRVVAGDKAPTGITFPSAAITLEAAALSDAAGNAAALGFTLPSRRPLTRVNA
jgi:large repetitive protein